MKTEIMWAVMNEKFGLYTGTWITRREAIAEHCRMANRDWKLCKKRGDKVVKVKIEIIK